MPEVDNIDDAVKDAIEKPPEEKPEVKTETTKTAESEVVHEIDASPEEIENALVFFRSLGNPAERGKLIETLAREGGYDLTKKAEVKQLERDAKAILREKLGNNYDVLNGDQLSEAFEELVSLRVDQLTKPALERISAAEKVTNDQKANTAMTNFFERNKIEGDDRETVSAKLMAKVKQMPATKDTNIDEYLDDLYLIVSRDKSTATGVKDVVQRIRRNAKDSERLSGEGTGNEERIKQGSHTPDLDESVRAAFDGKKLS